MGSRLKRVLSYFPQENILQAMTRSHAALEDPVGPRLKAQGGMKMKNSVKRSHVSVLCTVSKVGRDTRFILFSDALRVLRQNLEKLPAMLRLESARRLVLVDAYGLSLHVLNRRTGVFFRLPGGVFRLHSNGSPDLTFIHRQVRA